MVLETTWHTPDRLAPRPGPAGGRAGDATELVAPTTDGHRATTPPPARCSAWPRASRARSRWWPTPSPSSSTGSQTGIWVYEGDGYNTMTVRPPAGDPSSPCRPPSAWVRRPPAATAAPRSTGASRPSLRCPGEAVGRRHRRGPEPTRRNRGLLAGLAGQRPLPRPSVAQLHRAQRAHPQGSELRAHRRHHGGGDDLAPRDSWWGAQLGLPLHLDPRLLVHVALAVPARVRLGGPRVLRLRDRGGGRAGSDFTCRSCTASTGART